MKDETLLPDEFEAFAKREGLITESHGLRFVNSAIDVARKAWNAALQSGNSAQPVTVPAGYVLVPVEPTTNQWAAGMQAFDSGMDKVTRVYKAMLSAAPKAPDGWIPVSERLPEKDGNYWGWWSESKRQGPVWFIKSELQAQFQSSEITHWQPLPDAPKVKP